MEYGKDFWLTDEGKLEFAEDIVCPAEDVRLLTDAQNVLFDDIPIDDRPLYYMYRGIYKKGDEQIFAQRDIRYDITVILAGKLGREYYKTIGHFHPLKPGSLETYPEYYEVLEGEAFYLLQKNTHSNEVEEAVVVAAKKGDKVFIPSPYGHVTINPGDKLLVMANLVEKNFKSQYEPFQEKRGAAYYCIEGEQGKSEFVKNPNYHSIVALKMFTAPSWKKPLTFEPQDTDLYTAFINNPDNFNFLK